MPEGPGVDNSSARAATIIGAGFDTWGGPSFLQLRLSLLGKTVFLLSFGFFLVMNTLLLAGGGLRVLPMLVNQANVMHFVSSSSMAVLWVATRRLSWSLRMLGLFDCLSALLPGIGLAAMAAQPDDKQLMAGLFALAVTLMARAVLIPSTARRTLLLSSLAAVPLLVVSAVFHQPALMPGFPPLIANVVVSVNALLWQILTVALSTVTSHTIYGLRQQVKEASEIGAYTLEEKIGSGGMGEVWRARHRMLIRPAAVKLIRAEELGSLAGRDPELRRRRFEREARATAGLESPHTVQLYDFGVTNDGTFYYVMELLDGLDLDTLVERFGPVPAERAIHILAQVCASLDDAHRNGLVHRDIKPANIVVSRIGSAWDFVKVLDFGLVKLGGERQSEELRLSTENQVSGTPGFIAPEVVLGGETDHRVDVYSLGCVAYWLVTGQLVFEGPGAIKVMSDHIHTPPPLPSSRCTSPIPAELDQLILDCLAKDPAQRPRSARELQARLHAIPVKTPWTPERAEHWWSTQAPDRTSRRPVADLVLSQEARPPRELRRAR
ncbi:MAG TPA: serine/threonine-protein kinase [Polyangiaceae bacterium]|nr:serine/threonine-protein kinase [Polyangiaceae bacterium]